jgi:hypothetical protein
VAQAHVRGGVPPAAECGAFGKRIGLKLTTEKGYGVTLGAQWQAVQREAQLAAEHAAYGVTVLGRANHAQTGLYTQAFFGLVHPRPSDRSVSGGVCLAELCTPA